MKNFFKKLWLYLSHQKCELCGDLVEETYVYELLTEGGICACKSCCDKKK